MCFSREFFLEKMFEIQYLGTISELTQHFKITVTTYFSRREHSAPQYFYVTRIQYDSPCMIIKMAFVGGMSVSKRMKVSAFDFKNYPTHF